MTLRLELEAACRLRAEVEVEQAEMLKQGEQVGQQEGTRAQGQQEMTQRSLGQWSVPHCWVLLGEFVLAEPLLSGPSLVVSLLL